MSRRRGDYEISRTLLSALTTVRASELEFLVDLDNLEDLGAADPRGMRDLIAGFPRDVEEAWRSGLAWPLPASLRTPRRVVAVGLGGSAIGADVVSALAELQSTIPVQVRRGYRVQPMDAETLLVASSFSGETRETLGAATSEAANGAMRLALTTGGQLARLAEDLDWPCFRYAFDGPPRSALAWGMLPLLAILSRLDVIQVAEGEVECAARELASASQRWTPHVPMLDNEAKRLAKRVAGRPVLVVGPACLEAAARRWAGQLNENAKQWAYWVALPEADHNLITGFQSAPSSNNPYVVLLDANVLDSRDRAHVALTAEALDEAGVPYDVVTLEAASPLAALLQACHMGDWVSLYAAVLNGVDPMSTEAIERFKSRLASYAGPRPLELAFR